MKTKKFNYEKYGAEVIKLMEGKPERYKVSMLQTKLMMRTDNVPRAIDQWRRIYYAARKKAGLVPDKKEHTKEVLKRLESDKFYYLINHPACDPVTLGTTNEDLANRIAELGEKIERPKLLEKALRLACEQISSTFCPIEFFAWKPPHYCPIICTREMRIECRVRYYIEKAGDK
jgi:hypothetical protein